MTTVQKTRSSVYQFQDGEPSYIQDEYEVGDLASRDLAAADVLAAARAVDATFPLLNESRDGLPQRTLRVSDKATDGRSRRVLAAWGTRSLRGGASILTRETVTRVSLIPDFVQPYFILLGTIISPIGGGSIPFIVRRQRTTVSRTRMMIYQGQIVDSGWTPQGIGTIVANNIDHLYVVGGQPALLKNFEIRRMPSNQNWVWTIFEQTGWVKRQPAGAIEPGSFEVAELPPLAEYAERMTSNILGFKAASELYDPGAPLGWQT